MTSLSTDFTDKLFADYEANAKYSAIENAVTHNGLLKSIETRQSEVENDHVFSIDLTKDEVSNQKASGRCWMFAALNTFRHKLISDFKLESFELSQAHTFFWDKYEKSNWFLEQIIATADQEIGSRKVKFLLDTPQQDGGQWDMFLNIIKKYGIVPKSAMPETYSSSNTSEINKILRRILRMYAYELRTSYKKKKNLEDIENQKLDMLENIYAILCTAFGRPPEKFDFEYTDKNDEFHRDSDITPTEFHDRYIKDLNLDDYISIINAPNEDRPFYKKYTVNYIGNVADGNRITYLNLPIERLKEMAIAQLSEGVPVFFGSDVGQESSRELGILSRNLYNIKDIINIKDTMDKATKLEYRESAMTHAMMFLGVNLDENWKGNRWKVENSWGDSTGNKGIYLLTDDWFNSYVYQVVINKKHLKPEELEAYNENKYYMELEPWDPMGTLAD